jgi:hypothetical protein
VSNASFDWFWHPPREGKPGLLMIRDTHPGPAFPDIAFVTEDMKGVLEYIESRLPPEIHLPALRIYVRDMIGLWIQIQMTVLNRRFDLRDPDLADSDLNVLWESRAEALLKGGGL